MKIKLSVLWKKFYFRYPVYLFAVIMLFYTSGVLAMDSLLFPIANVERSPKTGNTTLKSGDAVLDAFFHPAQPGKPVILYSHGNGEILRHIIPQMRDFIRRGYGVMAYDYAGYGNSSGYPGEKQLYSDIEAAYIFLTQKQKIPPHNIAAMGFSLGSGPSCYLAEKYQIKALVIVSGFASAAQVLLPFSVPLDKFPNAERLEKCTVPLLLFHGKNDQVIPMRNGRKLFNSSAALMKKIYLVDNAGHNDIFDRTPGFFDKLEDFLNHTQTQ